MNAAGTPEPVVPEQGAQVPPDRRAPTRALEVALVLALVIGAAFGTYVVREIYRLRDQQTTIADRNRKGSLQLLRVQNDLASLATLMRDMVAGTEPYPMAGWRPAFERVRADLAGALTLERGLAPAAREASQQARIERTVASYWATVDRAFAMAAGGDEAGAAALVRGTATQQHMELSGIVSQFLVANNRVQEEAVAANRAIFDQVARQIIFLVVALLLVFAAAGGMIVAANRRAFEDVRRVTAQLRALSWRSLRFQEDLQRSVSRELHDDFGQIVTALGTMIGRARRHAGGDSALVAEIDAVRRVAQEALDRIRTRSQWLHPGVLDDFGLEKALARAAEQFERQTGIRTRFTAAGRVEMVRDEYAIHVYRIAQEALANVGRHSGSTEALVRLRCEDAGLELEIEDHGRGLPALIPEPMLNGGMGLVSMRERAELMGGHLTLRRPPEGGLIVELRVPAWKRPEMSETVAIS
jgi:signal transduction histidine kinase